MTEHPMRAAEERVTAVNAVEPRMPLRSKAAREYARYLKVWFIGENDDFDEEAWQVQVSELAAIEREAAPPDLDHVSERCPNKFRCRLTVGGVAGYANERLKSADLAAHFWVGCRRITTAEAEAIRARLSPTSVISTSEGER